MSVPYIHDGPLTDAEIRDNYAWNDSLEGPHPQDLADFDAWLADHDARLIASLTKEQS